MCNLFRAELFKRKKIETELSKVKKELEENKILLQEIIATHTQTSNKMEALLLEKEKILKKIDEELAEVRKKLEESKKLRQKSYCIEFKFEELKQATNNFNKSFKLGEGSFAVVYKGELHRTPVAIKKLKVKEKEKDDRGFNEEIETLSKVRHPHLVTLIGACWGPENLALVYEYLPGGSLEDHLSRKNKFPPLTGQIRIRIALDICSALCFLHSTLKSHGDIKPDNILLDSNYVGKLSDFGTCRQLKYRPGTIIPSYETVNLTGTFAYMDPDYTSSGKLTPSFDVYSFGLVLLRLATGKGLYDDHQKIPLRDMVETAIECKNFEKLVDVEWPSKETPEKIAKLGLLCFERTKPPPGQPIRPNAATLFKSLRDIAYKK